MPAVGPAFTFVKQIAVAVRDLDAAVHRWSDRYGIGPWEYHVYRDWPQTYRGQELRVDFRIALGHVGEVEIELVEPLDDQGMIADFLREHGEGVQHIAFGTSDAPGRLVRRDTGVDVERVGFGHVAGREGADLEYIYFDTTDDLGFVAEAHVIEEGWLRPPPAGIYPPPDAIDAQAAEG